MTRKRDSAERGKLRIGDDWNAITITRCRRAIRSRRSRNPSNTAREVILKDRFRPEADVSERWTFEFWPRLHRAVGVAAVLR